MQRIAKVTQKDVDRIIQRDFLASEFKSVTEILTLYRSSEGFRVFASILKLSQGDIALVKEYVDKANYDYRDIIAASEYPNYSERAFDDDLSKKDAKYLEDLDWKQFQTWFNKV